MPISHPNEAIPKRGLPSLVARRRLYEILPGALTWATLILPIVLSFFFPKAVAVFLIIYTSFWFVRTVEFSCAIPFAYWKTVRQMRRDWTAILAAYSQVARDQHPALFEVETPVGGVEGEMMASMKEVIAHHRDNGTLKLPEEILHLIVIATYKEGVDVLETTFQRIIASDFPTKQMAVILAGEERDQENFRHVADYCEREFSKAFRAFYTTIHPVGTAGEVPGKGSNITYACKTVVPQLLQETGKDPSDVVVTTLDADNCVDPKYFSILTYHYLTEKDRKKRAYEPLALFYNNLWEVPFITRISVLGSGFWNLIESARPYRLRNFASHAQSLDCLLDTDYWSVATIVEDGHQYWRSYFVFEGDYRVVPLFVPIYQDAVQNRTYWKSIVALYFQIRRWAWGCSDTPYVMENLRRMRGKIPLITRIVQRYRLLESYYSWATAAVLLSISIPIPRYTNAEFAQSTIAYNMGIILSSMYTLAWIGIAVTVGMSLFTTPPIPRTKPLLTRIWIIGTLALQWAFSPVITILFGSIPAIEAQTRLMLGKYLDFNVTEKVRTGRVTS